MANTGIKRKRKWWVILLLGFVLIPALVALRLRWFSNQGVILTGSSAEGLFGQCSRDAPTGVSGLWCPYPWTIARLETNLPRFLRSNPNLRSTFSLKHYYIQYTGFIKNGRYLIYANAFPDDLFGENPFMWRFRSQVVCDGGPAFFGFEFDPAMGQFSNLEFNGAI
ncbi:MAG: hypothetical protein JO316_10350 [Abitibacteriaceae bacterium]|nr:hypothetical protein [Abditibacteriaceae bacterium]